MSTGLLHPAWDAPRSVHAVMTLRDAPAGVSLAPFDRLNLGTNAGDDASAVEANRAALRAFAGLPAEPRWLRQVHGTRVVRFDGIETETPEADAAVTSAPNIVLAILTADCLPVLFSAGDGSEVAGAHAGWRGLAAGVLEATVDAMHTPSSDIVAWLGAAAGPAHYEIGEDVRRAFVDRDARAANAFVATRPGHWRVDLYTLARQRLADAGVTRIAGGGLCTIGDASKFFSHRRDARTGRMATLIWRE